MRNDDLKLGIRLEYEAQREAILKMLKEAGVEHVRLLNEDRKNLQDRFKRLGEDYKAGLALTIGREGFDLLGEIFSAASSVTSQLGPQGGLGRWAETTGYAFGRMVGQSMGGNTKSKEALGIITGELIEGGIKLYGLYESRRMIGAKMTPVVSAGRGGSEDFLSNGQSYVRRVIEMRQATAESASVIEGVLTDLSRVGIAFDDAGAKATQYALGADKVLNLQRGMTKELETDAVSKYGESWEAVSEVMQRVTSITQYWQSVSEASNSASASALASNQTMVSMYRQIQSSTKQTGLSMESLGDMLGVTIGVMHKMNVRPGMMGDLAGELVAGLAPKTGGYHETIESGWFIKKMLEHSEQGREILTKQRALGDQQGIDDLFSNLALKQLFAMNPNAGTAFGTSMLEGIAAERNAAPGDEKEKNNHIRWMLAKFVSPRPEVDQMLISMSGAYTAALAQPGATPESAMASVSRSEEVKGALAAAGYAGKDVQDVLKEVSGLARAQLSTADVAKMATEALTTRFKDDVYWPTMTENFLKALGKKEPGPMQPHTKGWGGAGRSWGVPEKQPEKFQDTPEGKLKEQIASTDFGMQKPHHQHVVASYTKATNSGAVQVDTFADAVSPGTPAATSLFESAANEAGLPLSWASSPALQTILKKESGGRPGIPNYTYKGKSAAQVREELQRGKITAESSATGLGQLTLANVKQYYPSGTAGIGNAHEEAVGMLRYIRDRYGSPEAAWAYWRIHGSY